MPDHGPVRGKHGEFTETRNRVNETRTDSGSGEGASEVDLHIACPSHGHGLDARGVCPDPPRWRRGRGWSDGPDVCGASGSEPSHVTGPGQKRDLPSATGSAGVHSQRTRRSTSSNRNPHVRRQGASACGGDGAGANIRAGFSQLLVWIQAETVSTPSDTVHLAAGDENGWRMDHRCRYQRIFRYARSAPTEGVSPTQGTRWSDTETNRQMAEGRSDGGRRGVSSRPGHTPGRSDIPATEQHLPPRGPRRPPAG